MISAAHPAASWFLYGLCLVVGVVVAAPLIFAPVRWARAIGWRVPEDTDLIVYLARCLGGVVVAVMLVVLRIAPRPEAHLILFHMIALISGIVAAVHLVGALEGRQPLIETLETVVYAGIAAAAFAFERALAP